MADGTDAADAAARDEELCALEAIFGDSVSTSREDSFVEVCIPHPQGGIQEVVLRVSLPSDYPSSSCPVAALYGDHLSDDVLAWAVKQLATLFTPGDVVLYNWVEWLREQEIFWAVPSAPSQQVLHNGKQQQREHREQRGDEGAEEEGATHGSSRRPATIKEGIREAEAVELLRAMRVTSGEPYVEKKSTFQAHVAPVRSFEEVAAVMDALLSVSKIRDATHNIMAYRIRSEGAGGCGGSFLQDYDDDGENAAGGRLLHLLQAADVRNVVVVVSRWFGGILLGPSRFTAINNTARVLLEQMGLVSGGGKGGGVAGQGGKGSAGGKGQAPAATISGKRAGR
ncbi:hypothetical protein VaNZ11_014377 [Volvox africanus]|uniref:RWD domain-containing protein n=1 Tax=Volvox africanus TaxID=51714 RepID=A0ABQ5SIU6_9CHLO|nr:hypothetical protein VaNZ11_014377 [Volvox africanus]